MIHTPKTSQKTLKTPSLVTRTRTVIITTFLLITGIMTACSDPSQTVDHQAVPPKEILKIGTSPGDFADLVRDYLAPELEKSGYQVTLSEITDIVIPNISVEEGSLDLNIFQHKPYMDEFNRNQKGHLVPIVQVPTAPYGIYTGKLKSLKEVKDGAIIGIPSNVTNFSRGLLILEDIGWIKLRNDIEDRFQIGKHDIVENPYHLNLKEIEAAQVVRVRPDLDYAIINGNFAIDAGIHFSEALATEPSKNFINWVVVHEQNQNAPWAHKVVEILSSDHFKAYAATRFANYNWPLAWEQSQ